MQIKGIKNCKRMPASSSGFQVLPGCGDDLSVTARLKLVITKGESAKPNINPRNQFEWITKDGFLNKEKWN